MDQEKINKYREELRRIAGTEEFKAKIAKQFGGLGPKNEDEKLAFVYANLTGRAGGLSPAEAAGRESGQAGIERLTGLKKATSTEEQTAPARREMANLDAMKSMYPNSPEVQKIYESEYPVYKKQSEGTPREIMNDPYAQMSEDVDKDILAKFPKIKQTMAMYASKTGKKK